MNLDRFTIALLLTPAHPPVLTEAEAAALQDAHLDHLANLHEAGRLLAAGPLADPHGSLRGLSILNVGAEAAHVLEEDDPAVRAGVFAIRTIEWRVPAGALAYRSTQFPHSVRDVLA